VGEQLVAIIVAAVAVFVFVAGFLALVARFYRRVGASEALVVTTPSGVRVFRNGGMVFPVLQTAEVIDLTAKTIPSTCKGRDALGTRDGVRIDVEASFVIRVDDKTDDIVEAAQKVGAARLRDAKALEELFGDRFSRAIGAVVGRLTMEELEKERDRLEDEIHKVVSDDLHGMVIDRVVIARVEPTPAETAGPFR
jgi:flotillin